MLEAVEGGLCLLEVLEALAVLELMRCALCLRVYDRPRHSKIRLSSRIRRTV